VKPPRTGPGCDAKNREPQNNIPVVSWLLLRGKKKKKSAGNCGNLPSGPLTASSSLLTGLLFVAVGAGFRPLRGRSPRIWCSPAAALVALWSIIDLEPLFLLPRTAIILSGRRRGLLFPLFAAASAVWEHDWGARFRALVRGPVSPPFALCFYVDPHRH